MTVEISCPVKLFDLLVYGLRGYFLKCFFEVFNSIRSVMFVWFFFFSCFMVVFLEKLLSAEIFGFSFMCSFFQYS